MRQGVICMLIAALVLQLAGGVVAGGAEPLAMTTQETIRTVAVSGVPTALMRGARLPERMPSFHTDAACHLADSWQSWSGMVWFSSPDGEHISKPLPAGTVTEPGVYYYLGLVLEPDGLASFSDAPSVTVCGTTAAVQRLEDRQAVRLRALRQRRRPPGGPPARNAAVPRCLAPRVVF